MTPAECLASYRQAIAAAGETVVVRRYTGAGESRPMFESKPIGAKIRGYTPAELVGSIVAGDSEVILLAEDLAAQQIPVPEAATRDKVVVHGKECAIKASDDKSRRVQGVLIAVVLQVEG